MKILHVAVFNPQSTNVWQADTFEELGHEVMRYDYRGRFKKLNKDMQKRDNELIEVCKTNKPDAILFSKCNVMHARVVEECRKVGITIMWYMDGPHNFNSELVNKIKHCDYTFCSFKCCVEDAKKYCPNSYRLHEGFDSRAHYPRNVQKIRDVGFIGDINRPERMALKKAYDFDVLTGVYNEDHARVISETKINININKGRGTSDRLYKILAAGGFCLSTSFETMHEDFDVGKDFVAFSSPKDMRDYIHYYLTHEDERNQIAQQGYKAVQKYNNINYATKILEALQHD